MWVNGTEIMAREYYESITTYGASEVQEDGSIKKDIRTTLSEKMVGLQRKNITVKCMTMLVKIMDNL